jgi:AraC-like DNA-binding protein
MTLPGVWESVGSPAASPLSSYVGGYAGFIERAGRSVARLDAARPRVSIIIGFGQTVTVGDSKGGGDDHQAFVVGAASGPLVSRHMGELQCVEVEVAPWASTVLLGVSLSAGDGPVALADLLGREAHILVERLAAAPDWSSRFALVNTLLTKKLTAAAKPARAEVRWIWDRLERSAGIVPIRQLAREIGWSDRHLAACFRDATGMTPKVAARRLRFDRARAMVESSGLALADIAAACGYSDQSHLTREFTELAGCAPATYRAARFPDLPGTPASALGE